MSIKNYKFVSPGIFVNEIDNSQLPASPAGIGPVIIGRAEKGPGLRPVTVGSFSDFVNVFGVPIPGNGDSDWRVGNRSGPTYGAYAAQAYLRNSAPLSFVRLLGAQAPNNDASDGGTAGWGNDFKFNNLNANGAYGLFLFNSGSTSGVQGERSVPLTGALAAIFYVNNADTTVRLRGTVLPSTKTPSTASTLAPQTLIGANVVVKSTGTRQFQAVIKEEVVGGSTVTASFNFDINSSRYIRKVFNTNPQMTNGDVVSSANKKGYFLGETFDRHVAANIGTANIYGAIVALYNNSGSKDGADHKSPLLSGRTPPIIACDTTPRTAGADIVFNPEDQQQLFTFYALNEPGDWSNRNIKISIQNIAISTNESNPYGTFSVVVRRLADSDNVVQVLERFDDCNLNPNSLNYVGRLIGTKYRSWNASERRYIEYGDYANRSNYIRIEINTDVDVGATNAELLPFGFLGMTKYNNFRVSGTIGSFAGWLSSSTGNRFNASTDAPSTGVYSAKNHVLIASGSTPDATFLFPSPEFRVSASAGNLMNPTDAYFGYQTSRTTGGTVFDASNTDLLRPRGGMLNSFSTGSGTYNALSTAFTLDDIVSGSGTSANGRWTSGSHAAGDSLTSVSGAISGVLEAGFDRFTIPMYGGYDGLDVTEMEPFRNSFLLDGTEVDNYAFFSLKRAMDSVADPEVVEMNLASVPGLTNEGLTTHLVNTCEDRADALAVIDLKGGYQARAESTEASRNAADSDVTTVIRNLRDRGLNSSYGCTFYPWVQIRDTINGALVNVPPSVAAIGTFSSSQRKTQVWFAPAGFNRGGLTEGSAGIPVVGVTQQLTRKQRDKLYNANINPIAKFPAEGIVIFGQKTLQVTPSALDRINVRRLLLFVKKRISQISANLLFDPNVQQTWLRFKASVEPFLAAIKTDFGLSDYLVVLDETTTTPDLVDRNIMYAKIFLKPTRAIEFIAIDFNITRTGASFVD